MFVSHSTGQKTDLPENLKALIATHRAFRTDLCKHLEEQGVRVFVDEKIPAATHWREHIFGELAECNAAVVLVNEQALEHSPWVDTEVRILAWRAWLDRMNFRLIFIPFGGVTRARIAADKRWQAIVPSELQMIPTATDTLDIGDPAAVQQAFAAVAAVLGTLPGDDTPQTSSDWILRRLANLLAFDKVTLVGLARTLGIPNADGVAEVPLRQALAKELYQRGPSSLGILRQQPSTRLDRRSQQEMLDLLATFWVDPSASASVLKYRHQSAPRMVFAINGALSYFTPERYVGHVCRSQAPWPVVTVAVNVSLDEIGEQVRLDLIDRFDQPLRKRKIRVERAKPDEIDRALKEIIAGLLESEMPVFVALPPPAVGDTSIRDMLKARYGDVRIILCRNEAPNAPELIDVETLRPEFELTSEKNAFQAWEAMLTGIPND